jgi:outer membrane biosynthesis protein TonB
LHLELLVDPAGHPIAVQLLESPGALAVYSAVHALRSWRFDPGRTADGEPTYCRYEIVFQFVLAEG